MKNPSPNQSVFRNLAIFFVAFIILAGLLSLYNGSPFAASTEVGVGAFVEQVKEEKVAKVEVDGDTLNIELKDGTKETSRKEAGESLSTLLSNYEVPPEKIDALNATVKSTSAAAFLVGNILPFLIPFLLIGGFIWYMMRQVQGSNNRAMMFGQSMAREAKPSEKKKMTFKDVAGAREAKEELKEVVDFLRNAKKFKQIGARIPKGVLLIGSPGTGKTLMARAVAGEASVPFYHISGSEFVEMFVGVGASRVRDLFKKAKRTAPCIVFIDEIDAVGRQRGAGLGGSHDEREQTLNQILVEMDGFDNETNVIVIAATNRPDVLDPALLRPGRFDRRVTVDMPDIEARKEILAVHAKGKPFDEDVKLDEVAKRTPGFSGADLANVLNEGAILAAREDKKKINQRDILSAIEKVLLGPERKSRVMHEKEKKITAYHEAGHALVAHMLPNADPVRKISIISRGAAGGYTLKLPEQDRHYHSKSEFLDDLAVSMAGYVAEKEIFQEVTTGPSNDLRQATKLARRVVTEFGMSDKLSHRTYGEKEELIFLGREIGEQRDYGEDTANIIDREIARIMDEAYQSALKVITEHKVRLTKIAEELLIKETLEQAEFEALMAS